MNEGFEKVMQEKEASGDPMESFHQAASATEEENRWLLRVSHIKNILKQAEIYEEDLVTEVVGIGSRVKVNINGKPQKYILVESIEADPSKSKVSIDSIIGKAIVGKKIGDIISLDTLDGKKQEIIILQIK